MFSRIYQQGDVVITEGVVPKDAELAESLVVAEGETTGHTHRLVGETAAIYLLKTAMYIKALEQTVLKHEEHKPIILPPGEYKVTFVREYDHFEDEARRVLD